MSNDTPSFSIPTRLRVSEDQRRMLDELEVFWGTDTSSVIRKAIMDEHAALAWWRRHGDLDGRAAIVTEEFGEQYARRAQQLADERQALVGVASPLTPAAR